MSNGAAVQVYFSGNVLIEPNEFFDCGVGIFIKQPNRTAVWTIRYNLIRNTGVGIRIHHSPSTEALPMRIYQNFVRDTTYGIGITPAGDPTFEPRHAKIVNNTFQVNEFAFATLGSGTLVADSGHVLKC